MPPDAVQRKARNCPAAFSARRPPRRRRRKHHKPRSPPPSVPRSCIPRRRPAKGTITALRRCEPSRPPRRRRRKHHKPRSYRRLAACRGLASHQKPSSERHATAMRRFQPSRPPRRRRRKHHKPKLQIATQRAEVLHPTRRRPAKGTPLPCGVLSPADHHGAVGGNTISHAPIAAQRAEVLHPTQPPSSERHDKTLRR
jgi:hypothetical protein